MNVFATPGHVRLRVSNASGSVRVEAWDEPSTEVELTALRNDEVTRAAIAEATVEARERGDRTEVVVEIAKKGGWGGLLGRGPSVGVSVRCPRGADGEIHTASADVMTTGQFGGVSVKTASGDVSVDTVGSLSAVTASGDVGAQEIEGTGDVKTASGDVLVRVGHGPLTLNLVSGDVVVNEAKASLSVGTVSGDQEIGSIESGQVKLQSVSGDVKVGVRSGLRLWIDATSVSGSMTSELPMDEEAGANGSGDPEIELRARTVSGDVRIVRAAGVPA